MKQLEADYLSTLLDLAHPRPGWQGVGVLELSE